MCKSFVRWDVNNIIHISKYFPVSDWLKPHAESTITSCCSPTLPYWINDVKMTSEVQPAADYWTVNGENLGTRLCYILWVEKQRAKWRIPLRTRKYFEWIIKQLLSSAVVGYEEFCRSRRASVDNTLLDLQNSLYPTRPHSIIPISIY